MKKIFTFSAIVATALSMSAADFNPADHLPVVGKPMKTESKPAIRHAYPTRSYDEPVAEFVADAAGFDYHENFWKNGTDSYWLFLSNAGLDYGDPTHEGQLMRIFLSSYPDEDYEHPTLPTGTFTYSPDGEPGTFTPRWTECLDVFPYPDDPDYGLVAYVWVPAEGSGTVTITKEGDIYTVKAEFEGVLTNSETGEELDRRKCSAEYVGPIEYDEPRAYPALEKDVVLDLPNLSGRYTEGDYSLAFYNVELDKDGFIIGGGDLFNVELFTDYVAPMNTDDLLGEHGPVDIFTEGMKPGCFMQGIWYEIVSGYSVAMGTSLTVYDDYVNTDKVGLAKEGTITVTEENGLHTFNFDLVTFEGKKMTGTWTGKFSDYVSDFSVPDGVGSNIITPRQIRGGVGCIEAPSNAEVFNMQGIATGVNNLPAGIYVVKAYGTTTKVVVK